MSSPAAALDADACYRALKAHDARFDGRFFTAVTSTGIYCRPVCRVRTPRRENCRFFDLAAQAEAAGFRPCLRCRPELAPHALAWSIQDASAILAEQAARLLDDPATSAADGFGMPALAARLGVSDRHLRRIFEARFGVSPLQYLQTRRLLTAKQLLTDTDLPVTQVGLLSGFASVRRFNAAFAQHYHLNPSALRRQPQRAPDAPAPLAGQGDEATPSGAVRVRLGYRPPYDVAALVAFFAARAVPGMEWADPATRCLRRTLAMPGPDGAARTGWVEAQFDPARHQITLRVSDGLRDALPQVIHRARAWLDVDADPLAIEAALGAAFPAGEGLRVPGCLDGFELAVRAILGQQITVAAARTLAARLVARFGDAVATPWPELARSFPRAAVLAQADGDALGQLGIVRQRQGAITALARAVAGGELSLHIGAPVASTMAALRALPGVGDWTAQYIAMRALRWPDAFPAGDVALQQALGVRGQPKPAHAAEQAAEAWRPWRSYAVVRAWAGAHLAASGTRNPSTSD